MKHTSPIDNKRLDKIKLINPIWIYNDEICYNTNSIDESTENLSWIHLEKLENKSHRIEVCNNLLYNLNNYIINLAKRIQMCEEDGVNEEILDDLIDHMHKLLLARASFVDAKHSWR